MQSRLFRSSTKRSRPSHRPRCAPDRNAAGSDAAPDLDQLRPRWYAMQAIACIDTSIWDAVGKWLGQPLWRLWGGYRDRIPISASAGITSLTHRGEGPRDSNVEIDFFKMSTAWWEMKFKDRRQSLRRRCREARRAKLMRRGLSSSLSMRIRVHRERGARVRRCRPGRRH